jgi:hypothetical protein
MTFGSAAHQPCLFSALRTSQNRLLVIQNSLQGIAFHVQTKHIPFELQKHIV